MQPSTYLTKDFLLVTRSYVIMKGFSAFLHMRRDMGWAHKISSWKYLTIRRPVLPVFLAHKVPHSPASNPFTACQRSTAAAAQDSMPAEAEGTCPWQAPICCWQTSLQQLARTWILLTTMHVSWEEGSSVVKSSGDCSLSDTFTEACERQIQCHGVTAPLSLGFPGKNTWVGCHFLLQGVFPTQGLNSCLLHCRWILYNWATWEGPLSVPMQFVLGGRAVLREKHPSGGNWWICHPAKSTMVVHASLRSAANKSILSMVAEKFRLMSFTSYLEYESQMYLH